MPERAVAGTPAATKIPSYKVPTPGIACGVNVPIVVPCPQIIPRVLHDAQHELGAHARVVPREFTAPLRRGRWRIQRLFHSFREASISSAIRREREREKNTPHLVSYATIDLAGLDTPESQGARIPNERSARKKRPRETEREREVARGEER